MPLRYQAAFANATGWQRDAAKPAGGTPAFRPLRYALTVFDRILRMADNPREHVKDKGFWDGGTAGHGMNKESSGRASGYPGKRSRSKMGSRTDVEFPESEDAPKE